MSFFKWRINSAVSDQDLHHLQLTQLFKDTSPGSNRMDVYWWGVAGLRSGPEVIKLWVEHEISLGHKNKKYQQLKLFSCSTQLSMLSWVKHERSFKNCQYFKIYKQNKVHAQLSMKKVL